MMACIAIIVSWSSVAHGLAGTFTLSETTIADINLAFDEGILTSETLVELYLNRIVAYDDAGPMLNTMIALNPAALETARALDAERRATGPRSILHGVPIVLKDQHDMFGLPTTSGARALRDSYPPDDAFIVRKLRDAGAIILGKTNLDELGTNRTVTLSSFGGQTRNPYDTVRVPGGSSGGTAAAIAANFAAVGIGFDWWGSIQLPSSLNGVVGLMPTRSLVSTDGILAHASERRGVTGPMTRTVADAAAVLDIIVGADPNDPITAASAGRIPATYRDSLDPLGLKGARIGLVQNYLPTSGSVRNLVDAAVADMRSAGAEVVLVQLPSPSLENTYYNDTEYRVNRYLESLGPGARFNTMRELLASDEVLAASVQGLNGDIRPQDDPQYAQVVATRNSFEANLLAVMDANRLDALVYPPLLSTPPVTTASANWPTSTDFRNLNPAPFLGFPSITLPIGMRQITANSSVPFGIEFLGRPFSEPTLIKLAYSFEQVTHRRVPPTSTPPLPGEVVPEPTTAGVFALVAIAGTIFLRTRRNCWTNHLKIGKLTP
jgi:Asp-tRNA(Asn)/Glu-tRNA(Gln) amidotransferase A subunit family amidase